ncbi:hypothetical protein BJX99DRAFT_223249 [Aspergillus californicus]
MQLLHYFALGIALVDSTVLATVDLGQVEDGNGKALTNIAWIGGDNPCKTSKYTVINAAGEYPCAIWFTLSNGNRYYERNCGVGNIDLWNGDGTYNSQCKPATWYCQISSNRWIRKTWTCY